MRLIDLRPQFLRVEFRFTDGVNHQCNYHVNRIEEAMGIEFQCPLCKAQQRGSGLIHKILCWSTSRGVPDHAIPRFPRRWVMTGTCYADLSLEAEPLQSRSIFLINGCFWHGFVTNGDVT